MNRHLCLSVLGALLLGGACRSVPPPTEGPDDSLSVSPPEGWWTRRTGSLFHPVREVLHLEDGRFDYRRSDGGAAWAVVTGATNTEAGWLELTPLTPPQSPRDDFPARLWPVQWGKEVLLVRETDLDAVCNLYNSAGRSEDRGYEAWFTHTPLMDPGDLHGAFGRRPRFEPQQGSIPGLPEPSSNWLHHVPVSTRLLALEAVVPCDVAPGYFHHRARVGLGQSDRAFEHMRLYLGGEGHEFVLDTVEANCSSGFFCVRGKEAIEPKPGTWLATRSDC